MFFAIFPKYKMLFIIYGEFSIEILYISCIPILPALILPPYNHDVLLLKMV